LLSRCGGRTSGVSSFHNHRTQRMPESNQPMSVSVIDLGKLSEPLTKLVEVVGKGIGKLYEPVGTVLQAKADVSADLIRAEGAGQRLEIELRTKRRVEYLENLRQRNIEKIISHAARELPESVSKEPVSQDWTLQFFSAAQDVCDDDMQRLWARILAGEVSHPGRFSRRTLEFLRTLEKWEAEWFSGLCRLAFLDGCGVPFVFNCTDQELFKLIGRNDVFGHFYAIGIFDIDCGLFDLTTNPRVQCRYFDKVYEFEEIQPGQSRCVGIVRFTMLARQLYRVANPTPVEGFIQQVNLGLQKEHTKLKVVSDANIGSGGKP
jgi:hypothetical protein